jgi:hypothetical protein
MSGEHSHIVPLVQHHVEQPRVDPTPQAAPRLATPEEIRAADQLFAKQEKEQQLVSGLLGMYTGSLLLRDLAAEHLAHEEEEEEERDKKEPAGNAD